ncbi:MAG: fibronectin type III domain-containing protein [bacterium]|nr:fibronectin type III domain-containing protein [bacterium]
MSKIYLLVGVVVLIGLGSVLLMGQGGNSVLTTIAKLYEPTVLSATPISTTQINLTWYDTNSNETGYNIYRSLDKSIGFKLIATTPANSTSYSDQGLSISTTYYYKAKTVSGNKLSVFSNIANATTPASCVSCATPPVNCSYVGGSCLSCGILSCVTPTPSSTPIVSPTPTPTFGEVEILRSGLSGTVTTSANVDALANQAGSNSYNPAWFQSKTPGTHTAYVTDLSGYTKKAGSCQFLSGAQSDCTVGSSTAVTCVNGSCSKVFSVTAGYATKVEFTYTVATPTPTPYPTPSPIVKSSPTANAGSQHYIPIGVVHTHGGAWAKDVDGDLSSFNWSWNSCYISNPSSTVPCPQLSNASGTLIGGTSSTTVPGPTFIPNYASTTYALVLKVMDSTARNVYSFVSDFGY